MQLSPQRLFAAVTCLLLALPGACAPPAAPSAPVPPVVEPPAAPARRALIPLRLGVIVPQSGSAYLRQYAEDVLEGVRVAAAELERDSVYRVEILVRDAPTAAAAATATRELASASVAAIIGPLLDEDVAAAAAARPDTLLPLLSPTGTSGFAGLRHVYALNVPDTLGAHELGVFAAKRYARVGVLRARSGAAAAQGRAFAAAFRTAAGRAATEVVFDPGTTTFATVLRRLRDARLDAFFLAADERDVRQLLPQVEYYGLGEVQVLASGGWTTPDGIERIGLRTLDGVILTLPFLPDDSTGGWHRFVQEYEALHRRTLDSAIPALGYDAARLALAARAERGLTAAAVARRLAAGAPVSGATGELLPRRGGVLRQPVLVRVRDGRLIPLPAVER